MYTITKYFENNRYVINFGFIVPRVRIKTALNFRIHRVDYYDGSSKSDPAIEDSFHIQAISEQSFDKEVQVSFNFNPQSIRNIKTITVGLCNELVQWYHQTVVRVPLSELSLPTEAPKIVTAEAQQIKSSGVDKSKICMLSTWNIKCGIAQYCKHLYDSFLSKGCQACVFDNNSVYEKMYDFMMNENYGILIVQYEPSIIRDPGRLMHFVSKLRESGKKVYFIIHSESTFLKSIDGKIDGFIYHKPSTINYQHTRCIMIPMGVPVFTPEGDRHFYRQKYGISDDKFVISTVGFMFKWKGQSLVLGHMVNNIKKNKDIVMQYLTSFHSISNGECVQEYGAISSLVNNHGLENNMIHITDYIPQQELSERLYLSDVGFLWSGMETTSSSASLKEFVSSRLPVVKTNSSHYHDVKSGCLVSNMNIESFIEKIMHLYKNRGDLVALREQLEESYKIVNYSETINKFLEAFNG